MPVPVAYRQVVIFTIVAVLWSVTAAVNGSTFEVGLAVFWWVLVAASWWIAVNAKRKAEQARPS